MAPRRPLVTFLDAAASAVATTIYTFSAMNMRGIGSPAPFIASEDHTTGPTPPIASKTNVVAIIHGADAASNFNVSSVTIGGVSGTEETDSAGFSIAHATAIYRWDAADLRDITNTDVVVTWSESLSLGCAVELILVRNLSVSGPRSAVSNDASSVTSIGVSGNASANAIQGNAVLIWGSTSGQVVRANVVEDTATLGLGGSAPFILNQGSGNLFEYACGYREYYQTELAFSGATYRISLSTAGANVMSLCEVVYR